MCVCVCVCVCVYVCMEGGERERERRLPVSVRVVSFCSPWFCTVFLDVPCSGQELLE
jgi:hypothetical protein